MTDFKQAETQVAHSTGVAPEERTGNIVVQVQWRGLFHKVEKVVLPELATLYAMDREVADAARSVRLQLASQAKPSLASQDVQAAVAADEIRPEAQAWRDIEQYLKREPAARFELVPPTEGVTDKWRAYFKNRRWIGLGPLDSETASPAVGVGSAIYVALENLLRFVEDKETIDG